MNENTVPNVNADNMFTLKAAQKKVTIPAEVEALKQSILAAIPTAIRQDYEARGLSEVEMANEFFDTYYSSLDSAHADDPSKTKPTAPVESIGTAEDMHKINQYLDLKAAEQAERGGKSRVLAVLYDKPILANIITGDRTMIPSVTENTEKNFEKWEKDLVEGEENRTKFEQIKAAVLRKEPMPVYINETQKPRVIGYKLETTDDNGNPVIVNMDKDSTAVFLMEKVQGAILPRDEQSVGLKFRFRPKRRTSAGDNESGRTSSGTRLAVLLNRKALQENPALGIITCEIQVINGQKTVNDQYNAKSDAYFEVYTGKKNQKGELIRSKKRASGKTSVFRVERIKDYVNDFGPAETKKGTGMSKKEKVNLMESVRMGLADAMHNPTENNMLRTTVAQIRAQQGVGSAGAFN